ncbi:MAG TPA: DUF2062 domain-containing protein [Candidatus Sulfopaludibacter sp.]|jgi:hypothetical protein|nr:DUF2062 domain-containing protein [Candidatus Sulfopaludibacter sp.]
MRTYTARLRASIEALPAEQVALLLVIGLVLGVFPIMGCPTVLCLLAAFGFRLNLPALQLVNNLASPLQLALLLPLHTAGARLCGGADAGASAAGKLGWAALHAVAGWAFICVPVGVLTYALVLVAVRRTRHSWCNGSESPA